MATLHVLALTNNPMTHDVAAHSMNVATALLVLLAGLAGGATSIGGILVVPTLTAFGAMPVREAIAVSNFSFLFPGVAAFWLQRSSVHLAQGADKLPNAGGFYLSAFVGAALGAFTLEWLPVGLVRTMVATLAIVSGAVALKGSKSARATGIAPRTAWCIAFGVGCGSAWSGTGGPVLLLPILIFARMPVLVAIALAQGIALPIAGAATVVNIAAGRLDLGLALVLGGLMLIGWLAGWRLARHLHVRTLQRVIALGLIAVGIAYGWQTFQGLRA